MITEYQYLKAKKVVADYESQQLNKPDVIVNKTPKRKKVKKKDTESWFAKWDKVIKNM